MSVRVRVPASTANLGPGFDVLAAALALHVEVEVERTGEFAVETDLAIARDRRNLCVRAFARVEDPEAYRFRISSNVPLSGGLGTSAAAIVAGIAAARALTEGPAQPGEDLRLAAEQEGHPDNVAAALQGGFAICAGATAQRIEPPPGLEAVLVVPHEPMRTREARAALPRRVRIGDAVFNVGQVSLLVLGLERGDLDLVARGLGDRLHQPHRAPLYPRSAALLEDARELGALGATVSGAGPSVLLWARASEAGRVDAAARERVEGWADVLRVGFEPRGAEILA
jgi:homoserine kinase